MDITEDGSRLEREKMFHDERFADDSARQRKISRFYSVATQIKERFRSRVLDGCARLDVLEYGCGTGSAAFALAGAGARVTGIDISSQAIETAKKEAAARGLQATFTEMNAEDLAFAPASFDRVCGTGILHHLELDNAMRELCRVLRPGGDAYFVEPLGHNVLINLYRRMTPSIRSADEHPLKWRDLELIRSHFESSSVEFHCLTVLASALLPARWRPALRSSLHALDARLLKWRPLQPQAWQVLIELRRPQPGARSIPVRG
jgi:ubiquinone/menaquinone biosynthesis C-methylase UbiE